MLFFLRQLLFFFRCLYSFLLSAMHFSKFIYRCYGMHFEPSMLSHLVHFFFFVVVVVVVAVVIFVCSFPPSSASQHTMHYTFRMPCINARTVIGSMNHLNHTYIYIHYTHMYQKIHVNVFPVPIQPLIAFFPFKVEVFFLDDSSKFPFLIKIGFYFYFKCIFKITVKIKI